MSVDTADLEPLHHRSYDVTAYRVSPTSIRVVGAVIDTKPAGVYIPDDPEPLVIHHMQVGIDVDIETMTIVNAMVEFEMHPNDTCPDIVTHYEKLVGLSVSRGFTRRLRELFGGPRACTHTTALIQAMAPVVVQSLWSMRMLNARERGDSAPIDGEAGIERNLNTCHVWAEDGPLIDSIRRGEDRGVPIWIDKRYRELDRDPASWRAEQFKA